MPTLTHATLARGKSGFFAQVPAFCAVRVNHERHK
jgi:hypothetical protein